ncbi:MAG: hypothetical protein GTN62_14270 [Gemmatimonadales bacterium]|nr:hypothetical protein [Gemmatimonadales bacterium]NIN13237.1 hypothetical protein [Gemmatimonadales bacterium]NIN51254.1 hypothetical protein [Gemmatimonadales bacterium]NIP08718.1 hypothetical protein [Gemmatimonadales bacterium]NIR00971.1 hypothetical protein [Gemmatimonadales bacterium]
MSSTMSVGMIRGWLPLALLALVGCGPSEELQQQLQQQLADLTLVSAQRDSLLQEVADHARHMSEISAELAKVQVEGKALTVTAESPIQAARDSVLQKIKYITTRVNQTEARLRESRRRIRALTRLSDSLRTTLEETIANYESVIATQRETIAQLTEAVTNLKADNVRLAAQVDTLEAEASTVYYVIGTKDELLEQGLVKKEGGARFLFIFGKRGETLVPARDLDPSQFTAIDKREVTEIPLPEPDKTYRVASRQDLAYLETPPDEKGRITGDLRIASPDEFWTASKFLIIVQR